MTRLVTLWWQAKRQPWMTLAGVLVVASTLLSAASGRMAYDEQRRGRARDERIEQLVKAVDAESEAREVQDCERANEGRHDLFRAIGDVLTDQLVKSASTPPDPARVKAYREGLVAGLREAFPDRDCVAEAAARATAE